MPFAYLARLLLERRFEFKREEYATKVIQAARSAMPLK
jgi:hypothetical protein